MMSRDQRPGPTPSDPTVDTELDRLPKMPIAELRSRYRELFRAEPPKAFGPDLLRRSIAHKKTALPTKDTPTKASPISPRR